MRPRGRKPVVLATVPYYLPGFKGGGKLVTVRNLVAALSSQFEFKVLTGDRDLGDAHSYAGIARNQWTASGDCEIYYAGSLPVSLPSIHQQLRRTDHEILHLNTIFSRRFGILPLLLRRFGLIARKPTIVAPRGELAPGALAIKSARKMSFLAAARKLRMFDGVTWHASGPEEARDISRIFGAGAQIMIAPDVLSPEYRSWRSSRYRKSRGQLEMVFLSRIAPIKNLHLVIEALRGIAGEITLRIAGPVDDANYWARCLKLMATLGPNIQIDYSGPIAASEVGDFFGRHGLCFLPSANESFGFVILEALLAGCPVLISDQTRWRDLQRKGIGWDVPLTRPDLMRAAIEHCIAMDADAHRAMSTRAREFALDYVARDDSARQNAALFHSVLGEAREILAVA
jgi:glycosyltransferase involved in cell wall biosynthesis